MSCTRSMVLRAAGQALALGSLGTAAHASDVYGAPRLSIPEVTIGNATYQEVDVNVASVLSGPLGSAPLGSIDSYDPSSGQLTVPSVTIGATAFANVVVTLTGGVTIGSVTGADTYTGGQLTIPYVQVGTTIYQDVVVTGLGNIHVLGGMPGASWDVYDPASKILSIPAVTANGTVYTNVTATLAGGTADVISVGRSSRQPQTIKFSVQTGPFGYVPQGTSGAITGSASSGLPVTYAVQTPALCALALSSAQEQYIFLDYTTTGGTNGSGIVGGTPLASGVYQINTIHGTTATGHPLGLASTLAAYPSSGSYYTPPYPNFVLGDFIFDDAIYTDGHATVDAAGIALTAPGDALINVIYVPGTGYLYADSSLFAAAPAHTSPYVPAEATFQDLNGLVALAPEGTCYVTAFQAGNATYAPAPPVTLGIEVGSLQF